MSAIPRESRTRWFAELSNRVGVPQDPRLNLLLETKMDAARFRQIKDATVRYIRACLGDEAAPGSEQALVDAASGLANRTPNGILVPKQEIQLEFNEVHKAVASWVRSLGIDDLIHQFLCPMPVRLVRGQRHAQEESRPYSSVKIHADPWSGDPFDVVSIHLPILGDVERTTIEFFHPPDDFEDKFIRPLTDYDEAKELEGRCAQYPVEMKAGYAYFADALALHRTARRGGGSRVTIQIELRRVLGDVERRAVESLCTPGRLRHYVPRDEWYAYGTTKLLTFKDTCVDARRGVFTQRPHDEPIYDVVDMLEPT